MVSTLTFDQLRRLKEVLDKLSREIARVDKEVSLGETLPTLIPDNLNAEVQWCLDESNWDLKTKPRVISSYYKSIMFLLAHYGYSEMFAETVIDFSNVFFKSEDEPRNFKTSYAEHHLDTKPEYGYRCYNCLDEGGDCCN